jgi:hypothetical protein
MTARNRKALRALRKTVKANTRIIQRRLNGSSKPGRAVVFAAAQYFPTLERLAKA